MKILIVVDKQGTAIDRLARSVQRNLPFHQIVICPIHPKGNDIETMVEVQKLMAWADVIDIHYWKSGQILRTSFPKEFESKPRVLFHMNPYDAESEENQYYNKVVVGNSEIHSRVPYAELIAYGIDLSFFKFNEDYTTDKVVNMSVARIEGKKGVLEVAQACKELDYTLRLVGRVSKADYMEKVMEVGGKNVEFWENATDEKLREVYYSSAIHVCNSTDGFESGTLPILECMACGVPVITRPVGHVPDIYDGDNMLIREKGPEDVEDLKDKLKILMENREWRLRMREKAWETVKNRDDRRMALEINRLYYSLWHPEKPMVSVIIPTRDHPEAFTDSLVGAIQQDYPKMEIVVADSGDTSVEEIVKQARKEARMPIKYIYFKNNGNYTLSEARNRAVIEADGEYLLFCDDRIKMATNAMSAFVTYRKDKAWLWGVKDSAPKGFVENFSFISRRELIGGGMFNERVQWYGGMTQEIRERFEKSQNLNFIFIDEAKAESIRRSKSKKSRRDSIIEAKFLLFKLYQK